MEQLQSISDGLFLDISPEFRIAQDSWQRIIEDPTFLYKIRQIATPWLVPDWYEDLKAVVPVAPISGPYTVLGVDGSQIYPDRHQGTPCFLINIGSVLLRYAQPSMS